MTRYRITATKPGKPDREFTASSMLECELWRLTTGAGLEGLGWTLGDTEPYSDNVVPLRRQPRTDDGLSALARYDQRAAARGGTL